MKRAATFFIIFSVAATISACKENKSDPCKDFKAAYEAVQSSVKTRLKSPASAVFSPPPRKYLEVGETLIVSKGECAFGISAHVDSQNSFGAMLRTSFSAQASYDKSRGYWTVDELLMAPN